MVWAAIANAALGLGQTLLSQKKGDDGKPIGETTSGWTNEIDGVVRLGSEKETTGPEPDTESPGPITKAYKAGNKFLGSQVGDVVKNVAGGLWDDRRMRKNTKNHMEFLQSKGLTPWEAAGSGAGGTVRASGSTLGSGPQVQAQSQQAYQANQADKERQNKIEIAKIGAGPAWERAYQEGQLNPAKKRQIAATADKIEIEVKKARLELKNFFPILVAKMGQDNLLTTMAMVSHGVDYETIITSTGLPATARTRQQLDSVAAWLTKYKGASGGIQGLVKTGTDSAKQVYKNTLGRK